MVSGSDFVGGMEQLAGQTLVITIEGVGYASAVGNGAVRKLARHVKAITSTGESRICLTVYMLDK